MFQNALEVIVERLEGDEIQDRVEKYAVCLSAYYKQWKRCYRLSNPASCIQNARNQINKESHSFIDIMEDRVNF